MPPIDTRGPKRKPTYGPPAPKPKRKPVYGPPAPKPKPKVIYGPPAPKRTRPKRATQIVPGVGIPLRPKPAPRTPRKPTPAEQWADRSRRGAHTQRAKVEKTTARKPRTPRKPTAAEKLNTKISERGARDFQRDQERRKVNAEALAALGRIRPSEKKKDEGFFAGVKDIGKGALNVVTGGASAKGPPAKERKPAATGHAMVDWQRGQKAIPGVWGAVGSPVARDVNELIASTPTSVAHIAKTAATEPKKLPRLLADPYIRVAKDPIGELRERPASTLLTVQPFARVPTRAAGAVLRKTGKQTQARPDATLPGTSFTETRRGSRDAVVRRQQAKRDRANPKPTVKAKDVRRRVDEFRDVWAHKASQAEARASKETKDQGMSPEAGKAHLDAARAEHKAAQEVAFAREFGANQRPQVGAAERKATKAESKQAKAQHKQAKADVRAAQAAVEQALTEARAARGTPTPQLGVLESQRTAALREVAASTGRQSRAQVEQARAQGAARVSEVQQKSSPKLRELQGQRTKAKRQAVTDDVKTARKRVSEADRYLASLERQMAREQQKGARLAGITEGRHQAGRMTAGAGRRVADQAEKVGQLADEIGAARKASAAAREALKATEAQARQGVKASLKTVDDAIKAERRRISGVAPRQADRLTSAIAGVEQSGASVQAARQRVRDIEAAISAERRRTAGVPPVQADALMRALDARSTARVARTAAKGARQAATQRHGQTVQAAGAAPLVGAKGQGRVFAERADAYKVAERLNEAGHVIREGGASPYRFELADSTGGLQSPVRLRRAPNALQPLEFGVRELPDGRFAVVPKIASERLHKHEVVGSSKATLAKLMRRSRHALTASVLPTSPRWLFGQVAEAGLRSALARAGPLDLMRVNRIVREMNRRDPGSGDEFLLRVSGGQFGKTGAARDYTPDKTWAEEFKGGMLEQPAAGLTWAGQAAPLRGGRAIYKRYTNAVLGSINGLIEQTTRKAMAGQAIKEGVFNERRWNALSDQAIADAAKGLKGTPAQVNLARQVDRMYGQYQRWSPEMRSLLMHWTPFLPWYLNTIKFLTRVLPGDHPVAASLMAAASTATEDWRKENQLSTLTEGGERVPDFLLGSYPIFGENLSRISQFTPWGIGTDYGSAASGLALPQVTGTAMNLLGLDWTGKRMRDSETGMPFTQPQRWLRAGVSAAESQIPLVGLGGRLSGLTKRHVDRKAPEEIQPFSQRLLRELPLVPVSPGGAGGGAFSDPFEIEDEAIDVDDLDVEGFEDIEVD